MRVELGGDHWADLKDAELVTNGDRREALRRFSELEEPTHRWAAETVLYDCYLERILLAWSYEAPLPGPDASDDERAAFHAVLDALPVEASNRLYAQVRWLLEASRPDFTPDAHADPKAVTGNSPD